MNTKLLFPLLFLIFSGLEVKAQEIQGSWTWNAEDGGEMFTIVLIRTSKDNYQGNHCHVQTEGERIDCNNSTEDFSIVLVRTSENIFRGSIRSSYSYSVGQIQLQYLQQEDALLFTLTTPPEGEYYIPREAVLQR